VKAFVREEDFPHSTILGSPRHRPFVALLSIFSRLLSRVSQSRRAPGIYRWRRSRQLFRLFLRCNPPFAQVWLAFTCSAAVCQGGGVPRCCLLNLQHPFLNQEANTTRVLITMDGTVKYGKKLALSHFAW